MGFLNEILVSFERIEADSGSCSSISDRKVYKFFTPLKIMHCLGKNWLESLEDYRDSGIRLPVSGMLHSEPYTVYGMLDNFRHRQNVVHAYRYVSGNSNHTN